MQWQKWSSTENVHDDEKMTERSFQMEIRNQIKNNLDNLRQDKTINSHQRA